MSRDPKATVVEFNRRINMGDLEGLVDLMTEDHRFVDTAGAEIEGRAACLEAWRGFFSAFPDYRNHFETVLVRGDRVIVRGRSKCSDPRLDGPALWSARIRAGRICEWRVYEDTSANRAAIRLNDTRV
jgi:ketosteroid isomerase-like protein